MRRTMVRVLLVVITMLALMAPGVAHAAVRTKTQDWVGSMTIRLWDPDAILWRYVTVGTWGHNVWTYDTSTKQLSVDVTWGYNENGAEPIYVSVADDNLVHRAATGKDEHVTYSHYFKIGGLPAAWSPTSSSWTFSSTHYSSDWIKSTTVSAVITGVAPYNSGGPVSSSMTMYNPWGQVRTNIQ